MQARYVYMLFATSDWKTCVFDHNVHVSYRIFGQISVLLCCSLGLVSEKLTTLTMDGMIQTKAKNLNELSRISDAIA